MRHVMIETVVPGQTLARSIFTKDGRILLAAGVQLTIGMINKLRNIGVTMVYIQDERFEDIHLDDLISEETRRIALKNVSEMIDLVQTGKDFSVKNLQKSVENIVREVLENKDLLYDVFEIKTKDNHEYVHALNVCLMSTVIGVNMELNDSQLYDLATGALIHDIGKMVKGDGGTVFNDSPTAKKKEHHTWVGFDYLRKQHSISILSASVALQHHEYIDGSGEPRGVNGEELHLYGKIVAVANLYDRLISPFGEEKPMLPYQACEYLMGLAGEKLDYEVVRQFLRSVALYPTGSSVRLTTGDVGVIVEQHKGLPARPVLRLIQDYADQEIPDVREVDLAKSTTIFISNSMV